MKIAICIITYNRLESLKRVLESINRAYIDQEVTLIISIDKSETSIIEDFADSYHWTYGDKRVIKHEKNLGLRKHVLSCGELTKEYDALIVLEDDIVVAESFLTYTRQCVEKFKDDNNIAGISLYNFPLSYHCRLPFHPLQSDSDVFLMQCAQSWGQVWMPRQWAEFRKWYDENNEEFVEQPHLPKSICSWPRSSWLKYHTKYCIENHKYFVYPYLSLTTNNSDAGTHVENNDTLFQSFLRYGIKKEFNLQPEVKYDSFFENEMLCSVLGYSIDDLCVDFYGSKENREKKRYWLTREFLPYKVLKSYAIEYRPYELNIIYNNMGNELFLYDTSIPNDKRRINNTKRFLTYIYEVSPKSIIKLWIKGILRHL